MYIPNTKIQRLYSIFPTIIYTKRSINHMNIHTKRLNVRNFSIMIADHIYSMTLQLGTLQVVGCAWPGHLSLTGQWGRGAVSVSVSLCGWRHYLCLSPCPPPSLNPPTLLSHLCSAPPVLTSCKCLLRCLLTPPCLTFLQFSETQELIE